MAELLRILVTWVFSILIILSVIFLVSASVLFLTARKAAEITKKRKNRKARFFLILAAVAFLAGFLVFAFKFLISQTCCYVKLYPF